MIYDSTTRKKTLEKSLTETLSQSEVVTLAVYLLGGDQSAIDTEDVAIKSHELAPGRFSWKKHPNQINLELIRVYLSDAKKQAKGTMLSGSGRTGWRLTQDGLKWAQNAAKNAPTAGFSRGRSQSRSGSVDEQRWRRERSRILGSDAWAVWNKGGQDIPVLAARVVFRIDSYAVGALRETKITRVLSMFAEDQELGPFLNHIASILNEDEASK